MIHSNRSRRIPQAADGMERKDRTWILSTASTVGLIVLMLLYLAMTLSSSNRLAEHTEIISGHPFEVVMAVGNMQTGISEMRIRTERLTTHNGAADIKLVKSALQALCQSIDGPLEKVRELYLGSPEDVDAFQDTLEQLKLEQSACLSFATLESSSLTEIEQFEATHLYPLYEQAMAQLDHILQNAQSKKVQYGEMAETLRRQTLAGSLILMGLMVGVLLFSQHLLRQQRRELIRRSLLFDNLSTSIDDAFVIRDARTEELYYTSLNMERVLGHTAEVLDDVYQGIRPEDAEEIRAAVHCGDFVSPLSRVIELTAPGRERRWFSLHIYQTEHLETPQVISVFSDCTKDILSRQALQDAMLSAERANAAKSDFLSRMSHEIRTPLNAIIGMTTIAAASLRSPEKVQDCLGKINFSSKHLLMLINDVLDMSKIESNKMSLQREPFDLSQTINGFVSTTYAQAKAKDVEFHEVMEGFDGQTQYLGDALRLNQILLNLGSNAVKFTPPGGTVTLTVSRLSSNHSTDTLRFIVEDNGIGMAPEALERIFKPFEQADETIAGRYGGTGLGMSITQNLVTLMSGRIEIESRPGEGTACIVDLPLLRDEDAADQPDFAELGLCALVVDDEEAVCVETTSLLRKIMIQTSWVLTGEAAVSSVIQAQREGHPFDFCLVDWKMPGMDGIEVTRRIRASVGPGLPIVMISAYDSSEIEEKARAAGVNAFLPKPLYRSSVYAAIKSTLGSEHGTVPAWDAGQADLSGKRLLVAEDNALNREIVVELLTMNGMEVVCAADGREALNLFLGAAPGHFDAILMDVQMPVMNGYEATRLIRVSKRPDAASIPIIAATANAFSDDISAAIASGMDAHVSKPLDIGALCGVLSKYITKAEAAAGTAAGEAL